MKGISAHGNMDQKSCIYGPQKIILKSQKIILESRCPAMNPILLSMNILYTYPPKIRESCEAMSFQGHFFGRDLLW